MKRIATMLAVAIAAVVATSLIGAAAGDQWTPTGASASAGSEAGRQSARGEVKLKLKRSPYGRVIFADGFAQYLFSEDGRRSRCYGECAEVWPPLLAGGRVVAGTGVKGRLLGTRKRRDGSKQVTYDGAPLYGYVHDPRGDVLCHDVQEFGGRWFAVSRSGERAPS